MAVLPMFPLGTVLMPSQALPLHVFEPRYRVLVRRCLDADGEFGVVLIERGSEVGGGDTRADVGTLARIVQVEELDDGRYAVGCVGVSRLRVLAWLRDDPHPIAEVEPWPDPTPGPTCAGLLDDVVARLRRALALASEVGDSVIAATIGLSEDPVLASHQAAAVAPIGPLDKHHLLAAPTPEARLEALGAMLDEEIEVLLARLAGR